MELANLCQETAVIRPATHQDAPNIYQLLRRASHYHLHAGWHLPIHWLGQPEFLVYEPATRPNSVMSKLLGEEPTLRACLVAAANPAPVAWVQVAAVHGVAEPVPLLAQMLACIETQLRQTAVTQIAWMPTNQWPQEWLPALGFQQINQIQSYQRQNNHLPPARPIPNLTIRPATKEDIPHLAQIEAQTYSPPWQLSQADLLAAFDQAFSFDIAILHEQIIGFQLSTREQETAHLARLTLAPAFHQQGIGSALLTHAIHGYQQQQLRFVSLNTQVDNLASQQLYKKFGFVAKPQWFSIWAKQI